MTMPHLTAPFPYAGGKMRLADEIWARFGRPAHYIEPFAGSAAVLLARRSRPGVETINDLDGHVANVWRAIARRPDEVVAELELLGGVQELALHAACGELAASREAVVEQLRASVTWCDPVAAARWIWGASQWIGGEWAACAYRRRPDLHRIGAGIHTAGRRRNLSKVLGALSQRLRAVRICCGDWSRVLTRPALESFRPDQTAILLDPPYSHALRHRYIYACEDGAVSVAVRERAVELGDEGYRVALCGMQGEHEMPAEWECLGWYSRGLARGGQEAKRGEEIWFSPGCVQSSHQPDMFDGGEVAP